MLFLLTIVNLSKQISCILYSFRFIVLFCTIILSHFQIVWCLATSQLLWFVYFPKKNFYTAYYRVGLFFLFAKLTNNQFFLPAIWKVGTFYWKNWSHFVFIYIFYLSQNKHHAYYSLSDSLQFVKLNCWLCSKRGALAPLPTGSLSDFWKISTTEKGSFDI